MLKQVLGNSYIDLSTFVDLESFDKLHPEICRGFATANELAHTGMVEAPDGRINISVYNNTIKPLSVANKELQALSNDNPYKIQSQDLESNKLATYLKYAFAGYDLYMFYVICDFSDDWRTDSAKRNIQAAGEHFPNLVNWIYELIDLNVFSHIGRALFFVQEAGGISIEHSDEYLETTDEQSEFIHIRSSLDRPWYIRDSETLEKTYIDTRASYFNDQNWHGGDPVLTPTYSFRVDGIFTDEFRKKISGAT